MIESVLFVKGFIKFGQFIQKERYTLHSLKIVPTIIPRLILEQALETIKIHSVAGKIDDHTALMTKRPFMSPHHTISDVVFINYVTKINLTLIQLYTNFD
jgi:hypothetical protein